jgi:hypothetical protein
MRLITFIIKFRHFLKDVLKNLIVFFSLISNIICNSFSDLIEFYQLMMSEIIIPRREYKREKKEARMNYKDHRRIIRHEYFSKKYHIVEQYIHKAITLVSLFISFCSFIIAFCMCYIILWKWPHDYKPCKLPSDTLAGTKINGIILDVPPMRQPIYPTSTDESFLDFIIRWFKSIFIANYTHEKYTGGKIVVIPRAKYEAMMRKKGAQKNNNPDKKKAFLDNLVFIDTSDLSFFLMFCCLLNSYQSCCDFIIYFNIDYLFKDVVNYIC